MAITYFSLGTGSRPTVGWDGADWYALLQDNALYRVFLNGVFSHAAAVTPGSLAFPKLDGLRAVLRDGIIGYLWPDIRQPFATTREVLVAECTGNEPIIQGEGFDAWQTNGTAFTVQRRPQAGGTPVSLGSGRPTGLSRILPGGAVVLVDNDFFFRINGAVVGTRPAFSGGAVAVEDAAGTGIRVIYGTGPHLQLWPGEVAFTPQIALGATALLVATWGGGSGTPRVALITLDEFVGPFPTVPPGTPGGPYSPPLSNPAFGSTPLQKQADAAKLAAARRARPVFPELSFVTDEPTQRALRLLFDRVFQVEQGVAGPDGVSQQLASFQAAQASAAAALEVKLAQMSVATEGTSVALGGATPGGGSGGSEGPGGGGGGGGGGQSASCAGSPATGHVPAGELTFTRAAHVICGTGKEWSQYLVATGTLAEREANAETLLRRMIWHLQLAGYTSGRQRNPSTAISKDKLTVEVDGEMLWLDVFANYDNYQATMRVQVGGQAFGADYVADAGIAD